GIVVAEIVLQGQGEVHGLAARSAVDAPVGRQAGDQCEAASGLRVGWGVQRNRPRSRGVVDVDAQMSARAADEELDLLPGFVPDRVGYELTGEQRRDIRVDGDAPGIDRCLDVATSFCRCRRMSFE